MLNLLGRARKGSTFSPSEGGGYKLPPTRDTTAPSAPRGKAPSRPYRGDGYERYKEREKKKYRANEMRELERRFRAFQKSMEEMQRIADEYREPVEFGVDLTPLGNLKDAALVWQKIVPEQKATYTFAQAGWTLFCDLPSHLKQTKVQMLPGWVGQTVNACRSVLEVFTDDIGAPIPSWCNQVGLGPINGPGGGRMTRETIWRRNGPATPAPSFVPEVAPSTKHYRLPPEPYLPARLPSRDLTPATGRVPAPKPYERPAIVSTQTGGRMIHTRGYHGLLRPGPRVKEVKKRMHHGLNPLISMVTEGVEWVDMMHDNLPKNLQAKGDYDRFGTFKGKGKGDPTPQQKAAAVYRHINEVDIPGLLKDIVYNHFEDKFFGKLGKAGAKLARDNNWLAGPQFGGAL